jgi:hypothetical protein
VAITVTGYPLGWMHCMTTGIDLDAATWKLALATSTYTPDRDTHDFYNDLTNELSTANGYTSGGATLASPAFSYDAASDQVRLDFTDPSWTFTSSVTWRYGVAYIDTAGASSTDPLMLLLDWGSSQTVSGVYSVTIDATGLFAIDFTGV